jgi:S1-C subfamily serine protease
MMNALGPLAKGLAFLMGKQPEEERHPRGFLGVEWAEATEGDASGTPTVRITRVVARSPAARADVRAGDRLLRIRGRPVDDPKAARAALAAVRAGDPVELTIRRGEAKANDGRELILTVTAGEGL